MRAFTQSELWKNRYATNKLQPFIDRYDEISDLLATEEVLSDVKNDIAQSSRLYPKSLSRQKSI